MRDIDDCNRMLDSAKAALGLIRSRVLENILSFSDQQIMSIGWSFGASGFLDPPLFTYLRAEVIRRGRLLDNPHTAFARSIKIPGLTSAYEDANTLVFDKPAHMVVSLEGDLGTNKDPNRSGNAGVDQERPPEFQEIIRQYSPYNISKNRSFAFGILHRLDKETSGAILVAKCYESFYDLRLQFACGYIEKEYLCLVNGRLPKSSEWEKLDARLSVRKQIKKGTLSIHASADPNGVHAVTEYLPLSYWIMKDSGAAFTLVRVRLKTGRSHQIRAHMSSIGFPLLYDFKYGDSRPRDGPNDRIFLHAERISFLDLDADNRILVCVPLPSDLQRVLDENFKLES